MTLRRRLLGLRSFLLALLLAAVGGAGGEAGAEPAIQAPERLRPGDPLLLWAASRGGIEEGRLELRAPTGQLLASLPLFGYADSEPRLYGALIGLPLELVPGTYALSLSGREAGAAFSLLRPLEIEARSFPAEDIALDKANTALRAAPDPLKEAEARALQALYASRRPEALYLDGPFRLPVGEARRSATFGDRRRYLYAGGGSDSSQHYGIDFAVPVGTEVLAPARGRVVFAEARIVTGKTLVLEHLPGLYSVYMHLSDFLVGAGELVEPGEPLAKSGNTGLSTGPHLHWELRASGKAVDPEYWVGRAPLDKGWEKTAVFSPAFEGR